MAIEPQLSNLIPNHFQNLFSSLNNTSASLTHPKPWSFESLAVADFQKSLAQLPSPKEIHPKMEFSMEAFKASKPYEFHAYFYQTSW